jgi:hypothetical protein
MGNVSGPSCPNPHYREPSPPPQPKPNPSGPPTPQASPTPRRPDVDPPPADQVVPPPAQQQVYNVQAPPPTQKFNSVAEAKACAQQHLTQNLTNQIIAAAPPGSSANPQFRAGAQTLASQTSAQLTETISSNFPQNAPPELLYQTITSVGGNTAQTTAPLLAPLVQNVSQARTDSNTRLALQGYDLQALNSNSSLPVARAPLPAPNSTSLANPNIVSNVDPKSIIADVSGRDDSGVDFLLRRTYSRAYEQSIARGLSPAQANEKGWNAVTQSIFPITGSGTSTINFEYKGATLKTDGNPAARDTWEVRGTLPLMRLPALNANSGVTYTNNDTNVVNSSNLLGNLVSFTAENQARNPIIAGGSVILGETGVLLPTAMFVSPELTARLAPHLTTHSMGLIDMGNSDAGRYDLGRLSINAFSTDFRLGYNSDKGMFGKLQVEHSLEVQALSIQNRNNDGALDNFIPLFGKASLKGEPLSSDKPAKDGWDMTRHLLGVSGGEVTYGAKMDFNEPFVWTGNSPQNPDYFLNGLQGISGGRAGPTSISVGRNGTVYNLNDPAHEQTWRAQFNDVPLLLQSMRGSDKNAAGSQLFLANPRTYLNMGIHGQQYQTSDQGWFRPGIGQQLSNDYVTSVRNDSEDKNADFGDWMRGIVTKPFAWLSRPVDERRPNELAVERPRDNAGLPQGLKPIQSTVAELNYIGATHPRDMSALAYVTEEQLIALNPDKVSYINRPNPSTGQMERVAAFKEGENLIMPVATSRSGELQMLQRATGSDGKAINVPAGKTGTTHVTMTPEDFYRRQVDFANAYNRVVDQTIARYGNDPAVLNEKLDKLSKALYSARAISDDILGASTTMTGTTRVTRAIVELGNSNNNTPIEQLGDAQHSRWIQQQLERSL